ncbi:hypothetical protein GQ55_4G334800 [Panicum hallii var. hallii]|uniref:Uncharacterized protein n=1 Tax=Panicum hallii var. hallii TaxID=1504633 RepID=A0A2T7E2U9_9POAL|nr:hypothetical protein GQ55_4G334800 [Panicum hallii var. hallii]
MRWKVKPESMAMVMDSWTKNKLGVHREYDHGPSILAGPARPRDGGATDEPPTVSRFMSSMPKVDLTATLDLLHLIIAPADGWFVHRNPHQIPSVLVSESTHARVQQFQENDYCSKSCPLDQELAQKAPWYRSAEIRHLHT